MKYLIGLIVSASFILWTAACGESSSDGTAGAGGGSHTHADGTTHDDDEAAGHAEGGDEDPGADHADGDDDHAHEETSLGTTMVGEMEIELAQGHGAVAAGQEGHLVVKLPYNDGGATIVRAWIGTEDRTLSMVGKGEYAPSHDDYDIHAVAPDPLPENVLWWIEVEKPDGTKAVGSAKPIMQ
jgi:hypothetical protein